MLDGHRVICGGGSTQGIDPSYVIHGKARLPFAMSLGPTQSSPSPPSAYRKSDYRTPLNGGSKVSNMPSTTAYAPDALEVCVTALIVKYVSLNPQPNDEFMETVIERFGSELRRNESNRHILAQKAPSPR